MPVTPVMTPVRPVSERLQAGRAVSGEGSQACVGGLLAKASATGGGEELAGRALYGPGRVPAPQKGVRWGGDGEERLGSSTGSWAQVVCPIASGRLSSRVSTNVSYHENLKK